MPTPVPIKILSRRHQRNRLMIVLLLALGVGAAARVVPPPTSGVHYGALASLIVLSASCVVLLLGLRRIGYQRAWVVFVIEGTVLWLCWALGWLTIGRRVWAEVLVVTGIFWASTVFAGIITLALIQRFWPPRRLMNCPGCEYDLSGLMSNVCPECGERFEASCAACGCALHQMAGGACPDCRSVFALETVLISAARPTSFLGPASR